MIVMPVLFTLAAYFHVYSIGVLMPHIIVLLMLSTAILELFLVYSLIIINSLRKKLEMNAYAVKVTISATNIEKEALDFYYSQKKREEEANYV